MEFALTATASFVTYLAFMGLIEVGAEQQSMWNTDFASNYFWSVEPDPNGSEAEQLAYRLAGSSVDWRNSDLCRIVDPEQQ